MPYFLKKNVCLIIYNIHLKNIAVDLQPQSSINSTDGTKHTHNSTTHTYNIHKYIYITFVYIIHTYILYIYIFFDSIIWQLERIDNRSFYHLEYCKRVKMYKNEAQNISSIYIIYLSYTT